MDFSSLIEAIVRRKPMTAEEKAAKEAALKEQTSTEAADKTGLLRGQLRKQQLTEQIKAAGG